MTLKISKINLSLFYLKTVIAHESYVAANVVYFKEFSV